MADVDRVVINEPTETENITLEQEAALKDVAVNETEEQQGEEQERPEWLEEKFESPEDLAKAYTELQKKLSTGNKEEPGEEAGEPAQDSGEVSVVSNATLEYEEKGELSPETFEALAEEGLPKEYVEAYIAGQQALADQQTTTIQNSIGGKEEYDGMIEWAGENLSDAEVDTFNQLVISGNPDQQQLAIKGLHAQYKGATGSGPTLKQGSTRGTAVKPFTSTAELQRAMSDQRYGEVPSYREEVQKRLAVSNIL